MGDISQGINSKSSAILKKSGNSNCSYEEVSEEFDKLESILSGNQVNKGQDYKRQRRYRLIALSA